MPETIIDLVRAGFHVSILGQWAVQPEIDDGTLFARPIGRGGNNSAHPCVPFEGHRSLRGFRKMTTGETHHERYDQ